MQNRMVKDDASAAIEGMLPSELADKLVRMENLRTTTKSRWFGRGEEIRILRAMVAELALAFQGAANSRSSESVQAASYVDLTRLAGSVTDVRALQELLRTNFRAQFETWEHEGIPLLQMARRLIAQGIK